MKRYRRSDRVVGYAATGGEQFSSPSGTLPRSTYRDFSGLSYGPRSATVYQGDEGSPRVWSPSVVSPVVFFPAERAKRLHVGRLGYSWRVLLKRMPSRVRFCFQRQERRQVLFAMGRAGYRGSAPKRSYVRNANSNYGC